MFFGKNSEFSLGTLVCFTVLGIEFICLSFSICVFSGVFFYEL